MKLIVNPHTTELEPSLVNEKEVNITQIEIEYNDIPTDYVKDVYFTLNEETYAILNVQNICTIPPEVLKEKGTIEIGIVISEIMGDELIARYNPSPSYFDTLDGSLKDTYENSEPITPTDKEQMEQALNDGLNDIEQAITNAERLDVNVSKQEHTTTVSITKQDGTTKSENVDDGIGLLYQWQGTRLGVKRENDISYEYVDLQGPQGEKGDPGDLTDYVKNTDYATSSVGGVVKIANYYGFNIDNNGKPYGDVSTYQNYLNNKDNYYFISKGTLENVLNARIGDINTALDLINNEVI